jgi:hypothetical protein
MKKPVLIFGLLALVLCSAVPARAWGRGFVGHRGFGGPRVFVGSRFFGGPRFFGPRIFIGAPVFVGAAAWPWYWGPSYAATPPPVYNEALVQTPPTSATPSYWYYCAESGAYYPYARQCPGGWLRVVPAPPAP